MERDIAVLVGAIMIARLDRSGFRKSAVLVTTVEYKDDEGAALKGWLYVPDGHVAALPGVLVVPEAPGCGPMPARRARMLAEMGYAAFVMDIYGDGLFVGYTPEAEALANDMIANPALLLRRVEAGLRAMKTLPSVDANRVAAVGYCLGGMGVLNLARSGVKLKAAVAFHGLLAPFVSDTAEPISTPILLCTGTEDPFVPLADVVRFCDEMTAARADYRVVMYGGAGHAFTSFEITPGLVPVASGKFGYDEAADNEAWAQMSRMLDQFV